MAAILGKPLPATGLLHLVVSVAIASLGALCDFVAVPVFDVILGRDFSASDHVRCPVRTETYASSHHVVPS
jgi:hypothetical protein